MCANVLAHAKLPTRSPPSDDGCSTLRQTVLSLAVVVGALWFLPMALAYCCFDQPPASASILFYSVPTAFLLFAALGGVMALWTLEGSGFWFIRMAVASGLGVFVAWHSLLTLKWTLQSPPNWQSFLGQPACALLLTWLAASYVGSLLLLAICRFCEWRLVAVEPAAEALPSNHGQYGIFDLMIASAGLMVGLAAITPNLSRAIHDGRWADWEQGFATACWLSYVGLPILFVNVVGILCGRSSWLIIGIGAFSVITMASVTATLIKTVSMFNYSEYYLLLPAALTQYFFVTSSVALVGAIRQHQLNTATVQA